MLGNIKSKWNELEKKFNSPPVFFSWFLQYQRTVIIESMTQEARIKGGLGNPPIPYYTNEVESKNNVLKQHVSYKASDLPKFVDHVKDLLQEQRNEVQRSVINQGEYRMQEEFKSFAVDQAKWFTLNDEQRKRRVDKFMKVELSVISAKSPKSSLEGFSSIVSSLDCSSSNVSSPPDQLALPQHFSRSLWNKAQALSTDVDGMVNCPGDHTSWMVKSESGKRPHFVKAAKGGGYLCDDTCLAYKSSKTCSHTVAVALKTGNLDKYIKWYSTTKRRGPSMTAVAEAGKPATAGKKRKGISKKSSKHIKSVVDTADDSVWHYPVCSDTLPERVRECDFAVLECSPSSQSSQTSKMTDSHSSMSGWSSEPMNVQAAVNASTLQLNYSTVHMGSHPPLPPPLLSQPPTSPDPPIAPFFAQQQLVPQLLPQQKPPFSPTNNPHHHSFLITHHHLFPANVLLHHSCLNQSHQLVTLFG